MQPSSDNPCARNLSRLCLVTAAVIAAAAAGCEKNPLASVKLYSVKGKVLLADGKPLSSGHVVFVEDKSMISSTANIESDGSFAIKNDAGGGLPEGAYKVRIEGGSGTDGKASGKSKGGLPFDKQFLDEDTSKLTATVTNDEAKNSFEFTLKPTKSDTGAGDRRGDR
jgi:hypothetical protein